MTSNIDIFLSHGTPIPQVTLPPVSEKDMYAFMYAEGKRRFGTECKHESTQNGVCKNCLRPVIDR